jgi:hypothetical protein
MPLQFKNPGSSRKPRDIPAFNRKMVEKFAQPPQHKWSGLRQTRFAALVNRLQGVAADAEEIGVS